LPCVRPSPEARLSRLKRRNSAGPSSKITVVGEPEPLSADDALQVGKQGLVLMSREGQVKWILNARGCGRLTAAPAAIDSILSAGQSSRNALKKGRRLPCDLYHADFRGDPQAAVRENFLLDGRDRFYRLIALHGYLPALPLLFCLPSLRQQIGWQAGP